VQDCCWPAATVFLCMTCSCQSGKQFLFFVFRPRHRHLARSLNAVMAVLTRVQDGPGVVGVKMSDCAHCSVIVLVFVTAHKCSVIVLVLSDCAQRICLSAGESHPC